MRRFSPRTRPSNLVATSTVANWFGNQFVGVVTGGTLTSDATYYYRTFLANGTLGVSGFTLTADILIIGGGGGGANGGNFGGGGGAGKFLSLSAQSLTAQDYTCTIGGGGAGNADGVASSVIGTAFSQTAALGNKGIALTGGTSGDAFTGSTGSNSSPQFCAGGGGGSTANGVAVVNNIGGVGGAGNSTLSSWATVTSTGVSGVYAGGGGGAGANVTIGGAAGGSGGGGRGNRFDNTLGTAGTVNTGSGGGGAVNNTGRAGGSGLIIFRYTRSQVGG